MSVYESIMAGITLAKFMFEVIKFWQKNNRL